jgi:hypothetical protein
MDIGPNMSQEQTNIHFTHKYTLLYVWHHLASIEVSILQGGSMKLTINLMTLKIKTMKKVLLVTACMHERAYCNYLPSVTGWYICLPNSMITQMHSNNNNINWVAGSIPAQCLYLSEK